MAFGGCARGCASGMQSEFDKPDRRGSKPVKHMNNGGINQLHNSLFRSFYLSFQKGDDIGNIKFCSWDVSALGSGGGFAGLDGLGGVFFLQSRDEGIRSFGRLRRYLRRRKTGAFPSDAAVRRRGKWGRPSRAHGAGTHTARHVASSPAQ